ncbi:MAG: Do family serine endopeptidase [Pseudomonadales bacterium]|nr:Do family serine endopeptidase [Pseudomonadales bacterium]
MNSTAKRGCAALASILLALLLPTGQLHAALPDEVEGRPLPTLAPMLERTTAAVVNVAIRVRVQRRNPLWDDPFFRRFFQVPDTRVRRVRSAGSGVIVDAQAGHIVTNHHVVEHADEIRVTLSDGREYRAKLVGVDTQVDLAVLKIDADELTELPIANSDNLRVGDFVVAIGNPFGLEQTVTSGIISALGRSGLGIEGYEDFIQTDASINPGNSGGALVDLNGRLVGINAAIVAPSGGNVGIGFAIPSNLVEAITDELIEHGVVRRGRIGMTVELLNAQRAGKYGIDATQGVIVVRVDPGGAADEAGIRAGDILSSIDGQPVRRPADYDSHEAASMVGDTLVVEVIRDGRSEQFEVSIEINRSVAGDRIHRRLDGARLTDLHQNDRVSSSAGVLVSGIEQGTPAWTAGFRSGDIVLAVNGYTTPDIRELARRLESVEHAVVRVYRNGFFDDVRF